MKNLLLFIEQKTTNKNMITGLLFIGLFNAFLLPILPSLLWQSQITIDNILDLKFSYSVDEVYILFDEIGFQGRKDYKLSTLLIDMPYALIYSFTYAFIVFKLLKINDSLKYKFYVFIPFGIGFFDVLENIAIITMLISYPIKLNLIAIIASYATSIKWIFALLTVVVILSNIFIFALKTISQKTSRH